VGKNMDAAKDIHKEMLPIWAYSHLKEEALDRTMWRAGFGRDFGPVVKQTDKRMNSKTNTHFC
jgi:hypothetical protein